MRKFAKMTLTSLRNENKGSKVKRAKHKKPVKGDAVKVDMRGLSLLTR